jgi:hypothetical protein
VLSGLPVSSKLSFVRYYKYIVSFSFLSLSVIYCKICKEYENPHTFYIVFCFLLKMVPVVYMKNFFRCVTVIHCGQGFFFASMIPSNVKC